MGSQRFEQELSPFLLRNNADEMIDAIEREMLRRGNPLQTTMWQIQDVKSYIGYQLNEMKMGKLTERQLGGFAQKLPMSSNGQPAMLPRRVLAWVEQTHLKPKPQFIVQSRNFSRLLTREHLWF